MWRYIYEWVHIIYTWKCTGRIAGGVSGIQRGDVVGCHAVDDGRTQDRRRLCSWRGIESIESNRACENLRTTKTIYMIASKLPVHCIRYNSYIQQWNRDDAHHVGCLQYPNNLVVCVCISNNLCTIWCCAFQLYTYDTYVWWCRIFCVSRHNNRFLLFLTDKKNGSRADWRQTRFKTHTVYCPHWLTAVSGPYRRGYYSLSSSSGALSSFPETQEEWIFFFTE